MDPTVICLYCHKVKSEGDPLRVSHGLHEGCVAAFRRQMDEPEPTEVWNDQRRIQPSRD
jgi:hypothetical protein